MAVQPAANLTTFQMFQWIVTVAVPAIAGFLGVLVGSWLSGKRDRAARKLAFVEKQLKEFYAPMVCLKRELQMRKEIDRAVSQSANTVWPQIATDVMERYGRGTVDCQRHLEERFKKFDGIIGYHNRQLVETVIPTFRQMLIIFREHFYLSEETTRHYYQPLLMYIDIWDRHLADGLPQEVANDLQHTEEMLQPLYLDLESIHHELTNVLRSGKA